MLHEIVEVYPKLKDYENSNCCVGQIQTTIALNMTAFLRREQSAVVWRTFYPLADRLRRQFQGTAATKPLDVSS